MTRSLVLVLVLALSLGIGGCGDSGSVDTGTADPGEETFVPPDVETEYIDWPLTDQGTIKKPVYGTGCRYLAVDGDLWESATNGKLDDSLTLAGAVEGPVTLDVLVHDVEGLVLDASIGELTVSLQGKAYYQGAGTATFGRDPEVSGAVVDAAICMQTKLIPGEDSIGELSLIVEDAGGAYHSVGGTFTISGDAIASGDPIDVSASGAIDIDLR